MKQQVYALLACPAILAGTMFLTTERADASSVAPVNADAASVKVAGPSDRADFGILLAGLTALLAGRVSKR